MLRNPARWTTALNVVLLMPLALFLRYLFGLRVLAATAIGLGVSLLFDHVDHQRNRSPRSGM